jgi:hypothetical protein
MLCYNVLSCAVLCYVMLCHLCMEELFLHVQHVLVQQLCLLCVIDA